MPVGGSSTAATGVLAKTTGPDYFTVPAAGDHVEVTAVAKQIGIWIFPGAGRYRFSMDDPGASNPLDTRDAVFTRASPQFIPTDKDQSVYVDKVAGSSADIAVYRVVER